VQEKRDPFKASREQKHVVYKLIPDKEVPIIVFDQKLAVLLSKLKVLILEFIGEELWIS